MRVYAHKKHTLQKKKKMTEVISVSNDDERLLGVVTWSTMLRAILTVIDGRMKKYSDFSFGSPLVVDVTIGKKTYKLPRFSGGAEIFSYERLTDLLERFRTLDSANLKMEMLLTIEPLEEHLSVLCTHLLSNYIFINSDVRQMVDLANKDYLGKIVSKSSKQINKDEKSTMEVGSAAHKNMVVASLTEMVMATEGVVLQNTYTDMVIEFAGVAQKCGGVDWIDMIPQIEIQETLKRIHEEEGTESGGKRTRFELEYSGPFMGLKLLETSAIKYRRILFDHVMPALLDAIDYSDMETIELATGGANPESLKTLLESVLETPRLFSYRPDEVSIKAVINNLKQNVDALFKEGSEEKYVTQELTVRNVAWIVELIRCVLLENSFRALSAENVPDVNAGIMNRVLDRAVLVLEACILDPISYPDTGLIKKVLDEIRYLGVKSDERAIAAPADPLLRYRRILLIPSDAVALGMVDTLASHRKLAFQTCESLLDEISAPGYLQAELDDLYRLNTHMQVFDENVRPYNNIDIQRGASIMSKGMLSMMSVDLFLWNEATLDVVLPEDMKWTIVKKDKWASLCEILATLVFRMERILYHSDSKIVPLGHGKLSMYTPDELRTSHIDRNNVQTNIEIFYLPTNDLERLTNKFNRLFEKYHMTPDGVLKMREHGGTYEMWARHFARIAEHLGRIKTEIQKNGNENKTRHLLNDSVGSFHFFANQLGQIARNGQGNVITNINNVVGGYREFSDIPFVTFDFYINRLREKTRDAEKQQMAINRFLNVGAGLLFLAHNIISFWDIGDVIDITSFSSFALITNTTTLLYSLYRDFFADDSLNKLEREQQSSGFKIPLAFAFLQTGIQFFYGYRTGQAIDVMTSLRYSLLQCTLTWSYRQILYAQSKWVINQIYAMGAHIGRWNSSLSSFSENKTWKELVVWLPVTMVHWFKQVTSTVSGWLIDFCNGIDWVFAFTGMSNSITTFLNLRSPRAVISFVIGDLMRRGEWHSMISRLASGKNKLVAENDVLSYFQKSPNVVSAFDMLRLQADDVIKAKVVKNDTSVTWLLNYANNFGPILEAGPDAWPEWLGHHLWKTIQYLGYVLFGTSVQFAIELFSLIEMGFQLITDHTIGAQDPMVQLADRAWKEIEDARQEYNMSSIVGPLTDPFPLSVNVTAEKVGALLKEKSNIVFTQFNNTLVQITENTSYVTVNMHCTNDVDPKTTECFVDTSVTKIVARITEEEANINGNIVIGRETSVSPGLRYLVKTAVSIPANPEEAFSDANSIVLSGKNSVFNEYFDVMRPNNSKGAIFNYFKAKMFPSHLKSKLGDVKESLSVDKEIKTVKETIDIFFYKLFINNPTDAFDLMAQFNLQGNLDEENIAKFIPKDFVFDICMSKRLVAGNLTGADYKVGNLNDEQLHVINDLFLSTKRFLERGLSYFDETKLALINKDLEVKGYKAIQNLAAQFKFVKDNEFTFNSLNSDNYKPLRSFLERNIPAARVTVSKAYAKMDLHLLKADSWSISNVIDGIGKAANDVTTTLTTFGGAEKLLGAKGAFVFTVLTGGGLTFGASLTTMGIGWGCFALFRSVGLKAFFGGRDNPPQQQGRARRADVQQPPRPQPQTGFSTFAKVVMGLTSIGTFVAVAAATYLTMSNESSGVRRIDDPPPAAIKKEKNKSSAVLTDIGLIIQKIDAIVKKIGNQIAIDRKRVDMCNRISNDLFGSGFFLDRLCLFARDERTRIFMKNTRRDESLDDPDFSVISQEVVDIINESAVVKKEIIDFLYVFFNYDVEIDPVTNVYKEIVKEGFDMSKDNIENNWKPLLEILILATWNQSKYGN